MKVTKVAKMSVNTYSTRDCLAIAKLLVLCRSTLNDSSLTL